jgi:hypothetical protein
VPGILVIALLEEKELRDHFGDAYQTYCRAVPRFLPKLGGSVRAAKLKDKPYTGHR